LVYYQHDSHFSIADHTAGTLGESSIAYISRTTQYQKFTQSECADEFVATGKLNTPSPAKVAAGSTMRPTQYK